jgi:ribosomal protein L29
MPISPWASAEIKLLMPKSKLSNPVLEPEHAAALDVNPSAPPLEAEPPHQRLARLNRELVKATETIQWLKKQWAQRNLKAQGCRQAVSTAEVTHFENEKRDLAAKILGLQTEIAQVNRELRALKVAAASNGAKDTALVRKIRKSKACPLREHAAFDQYFRLAAENELEAGLYNRIEAAAKSRLSQALKTGIEE